MTTTKKQPAFMVQHGDRWRLKQCNTCGGDLFWVEDTLESYWECLQCSKHQDVHDKFAEIPKRDSRWRISLDYLSQIGKTG
jgi:Zn ribbon nucleic-acid-binding protein